MPPSLSGIINQYINLMVYFITHSIHSISWPSKTWQLLPSAPAAPGPGEQQCSQHRTCTHRLSWGGRGPLRERPRSSGLPAQGIFTKANRLCVRGVTLISSCSKKQKCTYRTCAHLCQDLLASGFWVHLLGPYICLVTQVQLPDTLMELPAPG